MPDFEQVADDEQVGELGDRCVRVAVDGHDRARRPHPDLVLDGAADAEREVELGLDDLAGLPDLLAVRDPAGIDRRAGRPDRATELLRDLLDDPEAVRARRRPRPPATMILASSIGACGAGLADPLHDADRGKRRGALRRAGFDRARRRRPASRS